MDNSKFNISIGHGIGSGGNLAIHSELRLIKIGLLYGDTISLHSPKSEMLLIAVEALVNQPTKHNIQRLAGIVGQEQRAEFYQVADMIEQLDDAITSLRGLPRSQRRVQEKKFLALREQAFASMRVGMNGIFGPLGILDIDKLVRRGLLNLEKYEHEMASGSFAEKFTEGVFKTIASQNSFPLLDREMSNLIDLYIKEKRPELSNMRKERAAQTGLSAHFIQRLPHFEQAGVDEILDIRKLLVRPLSKFRAAMVEYSKTIQSATWERDFAIEADELYNLKIAPAVMEIEEAVSINRVVQNIYQKSVINTATAGTLTLAVSNLLMPSEIDKNISNIVGGILGLGTVAAGEYFQERTKAEQNQMYFLYKANQLLR
ncbi:hypothetical protein [Deinococcus indicus]|uniref:hypothetical protein n=1 Tax=Deinococcus indicus TaxID=223556 RepID=UPI001177B079|nr:hypothetical protein [Deinococcus indicus]